MQKPTVTQRIFDAVEVLLTPAVWVQNHPYSPTWDAKLTELLDREERFVAINNYRARLGAYTLWIANQPYAAFHPDGLSVAPRRSTILRARRLCIADGLIEHMSIEHRVRALIAKAEGGAL